MSSAIVAADARAGRFAAMAADALRGVGWVQVRIAVLYGLGISAFNTAVFSIQWLEMSAQMLPVPLFILRDAIWDQVVAFCLVLAVVVADRAVDEGARPRTAYAVATLASFVLAYLLRQPVILAFDSLVGHLGTPADQELPDAVKRHVFWALFILPQGLVMNASAVFLYADRRAARKTATRLRSAELDRTRSSRLAFESRLQAMQARIEPQFLFNTLAQVERLHEDDPAQAGNMLDALISYLRAAMPMMRDTSSTVGREIELARAYLDIVRLRLGERLSVAIEAPLPGANDIRMPPMMLLPLIDHAIVRGLEPATGASAGAGAISIHTDVRDGRLRLLIRDSGVGFAPETGGDGIAALRERLDALYGSSARLELRRADPRATEAVLDLPLESSASADAHTASSFPEAAP